MIATQKKGTGGIPINLLGREFGYLTVIEQRPTRNHMAQWLCKCQCGRLKEVRGQNLKNGRTRSCGCSIGLLNNETRDANPHRKPPVVRPNRGGGMVRAKKEPEPVEVAIRPVMDVKAKWINTFKKMRDTGTPKRDLLPLMEEVGVSWEEVLGAG